MDEAPPQSPPLEPVPVSVPPAPGPGPFRAGKAFLALIFNFGGQIVFALAAMLLQILLVRGSGIRRHPERLLPWGLLGAGIGSAVSVLWVTRRWARELARDRSPSGLGLVRPPIRLILLSALAGTAIAAANLTGLLYLGSSSAHSPEGPIARLANQSGTARLIWAFFAVVIAPPTEELLFRGLILKGLAASWGIRAASVVTTLIFVALHLQETRSNLPALAAIGVLAVAVLLARLWTGSLYCSTALHFAYNLLIVMVVYAARGF